MPDAIAPDGSEITLLVTDAARASLVGVRMAAGETSRPVRHRTVEEIWYSRGSSLQQLAPELEMAGSETV